MLVRIVHCPTSCHTFFIDYDLDGPSLAFSIYSLCKHTCVEINGDQSDKNKQRLFIHSELALTRESAIPCHLFSRHSKTSRGVGMLYSANQGRFQDTLSGSCGPGETVGGAN